MLEWGMVCSVQETKGCEGRNSSAYRRREGKKSWQRQCRLCFADGLSPFHVEVLAVGKTGVREIEDKQKRGKPESQIETSETTAISAFIYTASEH